MINVKRAKWFCCEDISQIENYNEAVSSSERWCCHHRRGLDEMSSDELKAKGLYKKRPASELIFIPLSEHASMHGKHRTEVSKERIRQKMLGNKNAFGLHWFNNGTENVRAKECPDGYTSGQLEHWYNDGIRTIRASECPPGFVPGRIVPKMSGELNPMYGTTGEKCPVYNTRWFNNGSICVRTKECPPGFVPGRIFKKVS